LYGQVLFFSHLRKAQANLLHKEQWVIAKSALALECIQNFAETNAFGMKHNLTVGVGDGDRTHKLGRSICRILKFSQKAGNPIRIVFCHNEPNKPLAQRQGRVRKGRNHL
jgi:hypothetical protein